jgi:hypothetical protein
MPPGAKDVPSPLSLSIHTLHLDFKDGSGLPTGDGRAQAFPKPQAVQISGGRQDHFRRPGTGELKKRVTLPSVTRTQGGSNEIAVSARDYLLFRGGQTTKAAGLADAEAAAVGLNEPAKGGDAP